MNRKIEKAVEILVGQFGAWSIEIQEDVEAEARVADGKDSARKIAQAAMARS